MHRRTLCLTPECSKLWPIRPGLCFLYDTIIIDAKDYDDILADADTSTYNWLVARNVERLKMEGILRLESYRPLLSGHVRTFIHQRACDFINALPEKRQLSLTVFSHEEYAAYLRAQILFCKDDEKKFGSLSKRLRKSGDSHPF